MRGGAGHHRILQKLPGINAAAGERYACTMTWRVIEYAKAAGDGFHAIAAFVIQMDGVTKVLPNTATHPEFAAAYEEAVAAGVQVLMLPCHVEPDSLEILPGPSAVCRTGH